MNHTLVPSRFRRDADDAPQVAVVEHLAPTPRWHRPVLRALAVVGVIVVLAGAALWAHGDRWFSVSTPSMGTTAPVGTLVLTAPVQLHDLRVGDVIAFVPPTEPAVTYTHRIITVSPAGVTTRGDINGATDPWTLTQHDIVGRAVLIAPGFGYLLRALPLMLLGAMVVWTFTRLWIRPSRRGPARLAGVAATYVVCATTIRPFLGVVQLVTTTDPDGTAHVSAVSTGLLPIRLAPTAGHGIAKPLDLSYGGTGMINLHGAGGGQFAVAAHLHLSFWHWVAMLVVWSIPVLWVLAVGFRPVISTPAAETDASDDDDHTETLARSGTVS